MDPVYLTHARLVLTSEAAFLQGGGQHKTNQHQGVDRSSDERGADHWRFFHPTLPNDWLRIKDRKRQRERQTYSCHVK